MSRRAPREVPMRAFHAEVVDVIDLAASMRRIILGGPGLTDFRSTGVGDEYVRLLFPDDPWDVLTLPGTLGDALDYSAIDMSRLRTYTVRAFDADTKRLTIDFVIHPGGLAAGWALAAQPGQVIGVSSPTALYDPPADISWQILLADLAALPAAARLAEGAPEGVRTCLVVEIPDAGARVPIAARPGLAVHWIVGGNGRADSRMADALRAFPVPGADCYVWVAGESRVLRGIRAHLRRGLGLPATRFKAVGYWTADAERWHDVYESLDPQIRADLDALWASDRPVEDIEEEFDDRLTRLGL